jgi:exodeoxyribonuclease VII large subunit
MARKRQEIIRQLKEEGVFDLQKGLQLPLFCQHIAVISSQTAAGYGDFCNQLADNPYGFKFNIELFPAIMQGDGIEQSIITALEQIYSRCEEPGMWSKGIHPFDCVVIIRGGGATSDMSGFDTLALAENAANFPLPIITGIGHDRDESILDMVSHTRVKTPTAVAALLIDHLKGVLDAIEEAQSMITHYAQQKLSVKKQQLTTIQEILPKLFAMVKTRQVAKIDNLNNRMLSAIQQRIIEQQATLSATTSKIPILLSQRLMAERHRLQLTEEKTKTLDPVLLLNRGYSITLCQGKAVKDVNSLNAGDEIETRLANGTIHSKITTT